jgi:hypothetical protein
MNGKLSPFTRSSLGRSADGSKQRALGTEGASL